MANALGERRKINAKVKHQNAKLRRSDMFIEKKRKLQITASPEKANRIENVFVRLHQESLGALD
jgi:hypothetical protein